MTALHFTPADVNRFMGYVLQLPGRLILPEGRVTSACWPWLGARSRGSGNRLWYGSFRLGRRTVRAHRFSCEAVAGLPPLPEGWHRDHICVFSLCVNPEHIEYVSSEENQQRKMGRQGLEYITPVQSPFTSVR